MKVPPQLLPLLEDGLIDAVVRPLRSGKEAAVFVVLCGQELRCAKVYKDARQRGFRQAVAYQEGRKARNSRQMRAMEKRSRYGRREAETAWHSAEVDALYRLAAAGVRVPQPHGLFDGVLLMELITGPDGDVAPRLGDLPLTAQEALDCHARLLADVVRMLCAGMVHGDLSEFNVLLTADGLKLLQQPQLDALLGWVNSTVTLAGAERVVEQELHHVVVGEELRNRGKFGCPNFLTRFVDVVLALRLPESGL
mgnify:CR=1 FL=1